MTVNGGRARRAGETVAISRQPRAGSRQALIRVTMLATAAHVARDRRTVQTIVVSVIALAAAAAMAREGNAHTRQRLADWNKRQELRYLRKVKPRQA